MQCMRFSSHIASWKKWMFSSSFDLQSLCIYLTVCFSWKIYDRSFNLSYRSKGSELTKPSFLNTLNEWLTLKLSGLHRNWESIASLPVNIKNAHYCSNKEKIRWNAFQKDHEPLEAYYAHELCVPYEFVSCEYLMSSWVVSTLRCAQ